jgi:hypothetical protein
MNNHLRELEIAVGKAQTKLQEREAKLNLHMGNCVKAIPNGLLPLCCSNLVNKFLIAKGALDTLENRLMRLR